VPAVDLNSDHMRFGRSNRSIKISALAPKIQLTSTQHLVMEQKQDPRYFTDVCRPTKSMFVGIHCLSSYKQNKTLTEGRLSGHRGIVFLYFCTSGIRSVRHLPTLNARYILPFISFEWTRIISACLGSFSFCWMGALVPPELNCLIFTLSRRVASRLLELIRRHSSPRQSASLNT